MPPTCSSAASSRTSAPAAAISPAALGARDTLAWGVGSRSTAAGTVRAWLDSPSHRRILISRRYRDVGLGLQAGTPFDAFPVGVTVAAVLGRRHC